MDKHADTSRDERQERLEHNRALLLDIISGKTGPHPPAGQPMPMTMILERILVSRTTHKPVPYEGPIGVQRLLELLSRIYARTTIVEGRLVGVEGVVAMEGHDEPVGVRASVGIGSQLALQVGPAVSLSALLDAIAVFDRHVHLACKELQQDYELVAQGYNPAVSSPSDVVPVPLSSNALLSTYLSRIGRYARDAVRCTACTRLALPIDETEPEAVRRYVLCAALSPIIAFLTDNTLGFRGEDPHEAARMTRSTVWRQVDATRCGLVPGTFYPDFGFAAYEQWVERLPTILFITGSGVTFSTGGDPGAKLMAERDLSAGEAVRLLQNVFPDVRWNGTLELGAADSLPPRLAGGYAALMRGLLASEASLSALGTLLSVEQLSAAAVDHAWQTLRTDGWEARVYGRPIAQIAHEMVAIAASQLQNRDERKLLDNLGQLWEVRFVPRDTLVRNYERNRVRTREEIAIELYGEGAVIPFDQLDEDPPAGKTAVIPVLTPEDVQEA